MLQFSKANAKTSRLVNVPSLSTYLDNRRKVYSLDLSSGVSCPGAYLCHSWVKGNPSKIVDGPHTIFRCFSASQEVLFPKLKKLRENNLRQLQEAQYPGNIANLVLQSIPHNAGIIRLCVGGDIFSQAYMTALPLIAWQRPDILFYFYTKSLHFLQVMISDIPGVNLQTGDILTNLKVTGSVGGKFDNLLDVLKLRRTVVVYSEEEAKQLNLEIDHNDSKAATSGGDFALLLHGAQPKGSEAAKAWYKIKKTIGGYKRG
jgi:hypothetical protein